MSLTDFWLGAYELVQDKTTGEYWHVVGRFIDADLGERSYRLADATHTNYLQCVEDDIKADFDPVRVRIATKPASVFGDRVDGVLRGPNEAW
ncbi:hypothetical protein [Natrinema sp. H-ect4]|uniref:hypothetical protein n=1 Tax=Natrinema sp. H-ect4 TaxID=3242699 RepID=UPI0035A8D05C